MIEANLPQLLEQLKTKVVISAETEGLFRRITESIEALQEQINVQKIRSIHADRLASLAEMSTGVAHELNQPLNAILMSSQMVKMWLKKGKEIPLDRLEHLMTDIEKGVQRCSRIITHMREFGSGSKVHTQPLDINRPITEVFELLREQFKSEQIEVVFDLAKNLYPIKADNYQIQQIFFQFISNARDAMNERAQRTLEKDYRKKITVRTEHDRDFNVIASIEDNGTGIPEENLKKIFEPFFTTKEVGKGAGLGLAIIYGLVKEHKGTVEVKSELGVGCKFILKFPPVI